MPALHKCLGRLGYTLRKDGITKEEEVRLKKDLTITTKVLPAFKEFQKPKTYKVFWQSPEAYYIPRYYAIREFGDPEYISMPDGEPIKAKCLREPLPHQRAAVAALCEKFDRSKQIGDGGVLSLPCGWGKTYCAIRTVCQLGLAALIVVPTECLMDQWAEAIETMTGSKSIGKIQQSTVDVEGRDFVIAMLHSISLKDYPLSTFDRFGITIFDECHHISSETFCRAMMRIRTRFTLGLSATPERSDGLSPIFYNFIGPLFHQEKRTGSNTVWIKKFYLNSTSENYGVLRMANGTKNTAGMTTNIAKMPERNALIYHILKTYGGQGRKILVLSSRKEHLRTLKEMIDTTEVPGPGGAQLTTGFYWGKTGVTRTVHRAMLAESSKCDLIFGIDVIAKEGLDIPGLNTLIFATPPGVEIEQPVGRILRKFHLDLNPVVVDLVDNTGNYVSHFNTRRDWYIDENYIINELTENLDAPIDKAALDAFLLERNDEKKMVKPKRRKPAATHAETAPDEQPELQMEIIDKAVAPEDCLF